MAVPMGTCPCGHAIRIPSQKGTSSTKCSSCKKWVLIVDGQVVGYK